MSDLPTILAHIAAIVAGVSTVSGCQGDDSCAPRSKDIDVLGSVGCEIANQGGIYDWSTSADFLSGPVCDQACGSGFGACFLTDDYIRAYRAAQPIASGDASLGPPSSDAAPDATSPPASRVSTRTDLGFRGRRMGALRATRTSSVSKRHRHGQGEVLPGLRRPSHGRVP